MSQVDRRTVLKAGALAVFASPFAGLLNAPALAAPADAGSWAPPFDLGGIAVHAMLTHTGDVLFFQYVEGRPANDHTSYVATWNYLTGAKKEAPFGYDRDTFCAGNNFLPDGRLYIAGGHDHGTGKRLDAVGVAECDIYDPTTRAWVPRPLLTEKRWYPTNVGLANGKTLIFGGWERLGYNSTTLDQYDPATNTMTRLPRSATRDVGNYPRMHLLPTGQLVKTGTARQSAFFDPTTNKWTNTASMLHGARKFGSSVLLHGCQKVLALGGKSTESSPATASVEILDTAAATPTWRNLPPMNNARLNANSVNLPDGQVLVVGGNLTKTETGPIKTPELFNPTTETWTSLAPQQVSRMYHSTALLLPDGTVFSASGENPNEPEQTTAEIFSPPYLFRGARPTITTAPATIGYGRSMTIKTPEAADIAKVTLIKASAVTHQIDSDQRSVPLDFTRSAGTLTATAPGSANLAPPGYYMLFVVNNDGVPSKAPWIRIA